jgi:hypothetical protein
MNSRRLIALPDAAQSILATLSVDSAGSEARTRKEFLAVALRIRKRAAQLSMSALGSKAIAQRNYPVCFTPKADIRHRKTNVC